MARPESPLSSQFGRIILTTEDDIKNQKHAQVIKTLYQCADIPSVIQKIDKNDLKSVEAAKTLRNEGNVDYKNKNYRQALVCYTKSVCAAPCPESDADDSTELALAFANRSAVLYTLNKYDECLKDIEQAFRYKYPDKLKHKLYLRRGECLQIMKKKKEAKESFEEAANALPLAIDLTKQERKKKMTSIRVLLVQIKKGCTRGEVYTPIQQNPVLQLEGGVNTKVPAASTAVEITYDPEVGRSIWATRDIKIGENIIIEDAYMSMVYIGESLGYCYNCLIRCDSLLPCKTCRIVGFCSDKCQEIGMKSVHDLECPIRVLIAKEELHKNKDVIISALHILIKACKQYGGLRGLFKRVQKIEKDSLKAEIKGLDDEGRYLSCDYTTVHCMKTYSDNIPWAMTPHAKQAVSVLRVAENHGAFKGDLSNDSLKWFMGGLLLQYQFMYLANSMSIPSSLELPRQREPFPDKKGVGWQIYPTISLVNHSCFSNAYVMLYGTKSVVKSSTPIKKGQQVVRDYLSRGTIAPLAVRESYCEMCLCMQCKCILCIMKLPDESLEHPLLYWECEICFFKLAVVGSHRSAVICDRCKRVNRIEHLKGNAVERLRVYDTWKDNLNQVLPSDMRHFVNVLVGDANVTPELLFFYKNLIETSDMWWQEYQRDRKMPELPSVF